MTIYDLWYNDIFKTFWVENDLTSFEIWRVITKHKNMLVVKTDKDELNSQIVGKLRYTDDPTYNYPQVWDWVAVDNCGQNKGIIHAIYPRNSVLSRQKVWALWQIQIIATNVDYGLIILAVDRDFSISRLERYLTICYSSNITPIVILNKVDLIDESELNLLMEQINDRIKNVLLIVISNKTKYGLNQVSELLEKGKTYCLLGSSGVWKSTLLNNLAWKQIMKTGSISDSANRWMHVTTHRELIVLDNGGIIIDNPGMREIGMTDNEEWLKTTFEKIKKLSRQCKYKDCKHAWDIWCAIQKAFENGEIDEESYINFQKLQKENDHYAKTTLDKKKKGKDLSKVIKNMKKHSKRWFE